MNKNIKLIEKKENFTIKLTKVEINPTSCNKIISVSGKLGTADYIFHNQPISVKDDDIYGYNSKFIKNKIEKLIEGVTSGWTFELNLNGIGFKAFKIEDWYCLDLGFSNLIKYKPVDKIKIKNMKNKVILYSIDKDYLKQVGLNLQKFSYPDVYKGKGITLKNQVIKIKKKSKS